MHATCQLSLDTMLQDCLQMVGTPSGRAEDHHSFKCADVGRLLVRNSIQNMALRSSRTRGVRPANHVGSKPMTLIKGNARAAHSVSQLLLGSLQCTLVLAKTQQCAQSAYMQNALSHFGRTNKNTLQTSS